MKITLVSTTQKGVAFFGIGCHREMGFLSIMLYFWRSLLQIDCTETLKGEKEDREFTHT